MSRDPHAKLPAQQAIRRASWMLGATLLVGLLAALALWRMEAGREALRSLWERSDPAGVLLGVAVITLATPIAALRWRCLLPPAVKAPGSLWNLTLIQCVAVLFNYALPGPVGELAAAGLVSRRYPVSVAEALMAQLVVRLLGLGAAAVIAALIFLLAPLPLPEGARQVAQAGVLALLGGAGAVGLAVAQPRPIQALLARVAAPLETRPGLVGRLSGRLRGVADQLLDALATIGERGPGPLLRATLWTFVGHTVSPTGVFIAAWAMGMKASWAGVVFTNAFVIVGALALFLFPGSQLGWDAMYLTVFAGSTGVGVADATAITVLTRAQQSLLVLCGIGALLWAMRWLVSRSVR
jgi:hypothetical protein